MGGLGDFERRLTALVEHKLTASEVTGRGLRELWNEGLGVARVELAARNAKGQLGLLSDYLWQGSGPVVVPNRTAAQAAPRPVQGPTVVPLKSGAVGVPNADTDDDSLLIFDEAAQLGENGQ